MTHKFKGALKYENLSPKAKREKVITEGQKAERLICPICAKNRMLETKERSFDEFPFANIKGIILETVYFAGRGSGFYRNLPECFTFRQMKKEPKYANLLEQIKGQCQAILEELE